MAAPNTPERKRQDEARRRLRMAKKRVDQAVELRDNEIRMTIEEGVLGLRSVGLLVGLSHEQVRQIAKRKP